MLVAFFLKGVAVGVVIAVPVGPVGVLCVRRTILGGRMAGLVSGLGAAAADAIFGAVAGFGLTFVSDWLLGWEDWLRAAGGCYLLLIGGRALLADPRERTVAQHDAETLIGNFASTFALTLTNPITILAFLGIFAALGFSGKEATFAGAAALVLGVAAGSLLWWLALTTGAGLFFRSKEPHRLSWVNRVSGGILLLSGAALLASFAVRLLR
jgi:threonine/homoserine/homoserine lactone efflux protein